MSSHPIVHIEIAANDPAAASEFYHDVFGWKIEADTQYNYYQFQAEGGPGGGFVMVSEETKTKPGDILPHIGTDDIDAALASVNQHGGKTVLPKTEIPGIGWYGIFTDPTGNRIGLYTALHPRP